jgi:hypothetical protein
VLVDQLGHERGQGIGVERSAASAGEDEAASVVPGRPGGEPFLGLLAAVVAEDCYGVAIEGASGVTLWSAPVLALSFPPASWMMSANPVAPWGGWVVCVTAGF